MKYLTFFLIILVLMTNFSNVNAENIQVKTGDWVKYKINLDIDSEIPLLKMIGSMLMSSIIPDQDFALEDLDWIKLEVTDVDEDSQKIFGVMSASIFDKERILNELELSYGSDSPFNHVISTDIEVGDQLPETTFGIPIVIGIEDRKFGTKTAEVFKIRTTSTSSSGGSVTQNTVYSYYEKESGLLLETEMTMEIANILFGSTELKFSVKAIDFHIARKTPLGGGCLIATATFGSELAPQVQQLRELRDNKILQTESGSAFITGFNNLYYSFSPQIADYERENPYFKEGVKIAITPMISSLSILNHLEMNTDSEVIGYGISLILLNVGMYVGAPIAVVVGIRKKF